MTNNKKNPTLSRKQYAFSLSLREVIGWLTLLVFISGWFFVLGIVVGRWYVPVTGLDDGLQAELQAARQQALTRHPDRTGPETSTTETEGAKDTPLQHDDHERLETASRAGPMETKQALLVKDLSGTTAPVAAVGTDGRHPSGDAELGAPEAAAETAFTIQVAALKDRETANQLLHKLKNNNFQAYVTQARLPDGSIWYRVRCGSFNDRLAAEPIIADLRRDGYSPLLVKQ